MSPARNATYVSLVALGLVFAATPALADQGSGSSVPIGCINVLVSQFGDGLAVYAALNNVIGFGVSAAQPGSGAEFAVMIVPSQCGLIGLPATSTTQSSEPLPESPMVLPLP